MTDAPQSAGLVALADRIELWPIDRLRPYERNPRTHSEAQVDQIAASMVEFGWTNPILVDEQGGILAGHGRLLAARKLGLAEVPVIRFEHLSEAQKRAYLIADNQLALQAGWTMRCWRRSWRGCGTSASTSTWSASMPPSWSDCWRSPMARRRARRPRTRFRNRRRSRSAGRATSGSSATIACCAATRRCWPTSSGCSAGSSRTCTFCDRPYNVDYANSPKDKLRGKHRPILNDNLGGGFEAFLYDACVNILSRHQGRRATLHERSELHTLQRAFAAAGGKWSTFVIWAKNTFTLGRGRLPAPIRADPVRLEGRAATTTGAGPGTRATCGSSTSRSGTTCIRP